MRLKLNDINFSVEDVSWVANSRHTTFSSLSERRIASGMTPLWLQLDLDRPAGKDNLPRRFFTHKTDFQFTLSRSFRSAGWSQRQGAPRVVPVDLKFR
ncbi:MAG TPA: hypothetical protein PLQ88_33035, partial [Blastocatellia bacterium]|nr:hypothetical protein [Blastocatellia bacterium]